MKGKHFLVVGYFGYGLVGDEAILSVVLRDVRARYPDSIIHVTSNNAAETAAQHGVRCIRINDLTAIIALLPYIDLVVVAAAGGYNEYAKIEPFQSIDDPVPYNRLCMEIPVLAFTHGVKSMIFAAGIDELNSEDARASVRVCFDIATERVLRDSTALQSLTATGARLDGVVVTCDPAWTLRVDGTADRTRRLEAFGLDPARPVVGLTLRHWDEEPMRLSTEPQPWESVMAEALQHFAENTGAQYILVASQKQAGYVFADDVEFLEKFRKRLPNVKTVSWYEDLAPASIVSVLSLCDVSVAMRHHGAILAAVASVPTVAVAYSKKVRGAFEDAGLGDWVVDLKDLQTTQIIFLLTRLLRDKTAQRRRLVSVLDERNSRHQETLRLFDAAMAQVASNHRQSDALALKYNLSLASPERSQLKSVSRTAIADILGAVIALGETSETISRALDVMVKAYPHEGVLHFYLGLTDILSSRDPIRGVESLERAASLGFSVEWCFYWQSRGMQLTGDYGEACRRMEAALARNPSFTLARSGLEQLLAQGLVAE